MTTKERPIGVFDSGIGGLTVAKAILELMPNESIVYFGDTARVPYGTKSKETVTRFALQTVNFLNQQNVKFIVIACNTVSAASLPEITAASRVPVQEVITPGARAAIAATRNGMVGVIGTERTIESGAYEKAIHGINPSIQITSRPCPLFVPLAEEGLLTHPATLMIAEEYLSPLRCSKIDTLVLACTHYPLLKATLKKAMGNGITLVDSATETAKAVHQTLKDNGLSASHGNRPSHRFFVSDNPGKFITIGEMFLGRKMENVERIDIEKY
jgi:glutamate racemase